MTQLSEQDKQALWLSCGAGAGIGLLFGLLFGGYLIHVLTGAVFGYCLDLWGQKIDRERAPNDNTPSLRLINNAGLYLAVMTVLVFIGSWQAKTWGYLDRGRPTFVSEAAFDRVVYGKTKAEVMKALGPKGLIVNIARGSIIDEPAMVKALKDGTLGGAALDVFEFEPKMPEELQKLENVVLMPHRGGGTYETWEDACDMVRDNIFAYLKTGKPLTPIPETPVD